MLSKTRRIVTLAVVGLALASAAGECSAAQSRLAFDIPRQPLAAALVEFAIRADISIGANAVGACAATSPALRGAYTPEAGLERLLAGSGCTFRKLDARAFEVVPLPQPPRRIQRPAASADPEIGLAELVVVATRRATPVDQLAYPVSAFDQRTLRAQGVRDASDIALLTPSVTVTNLGMGRDKILLRGLSDGPLTGRAQSMVGLYLDDVRLTHNAPDPDLRLLDIQSAEVLRGPQGTLYGAGSLGGVVHLVAAPPNLDRVEGSLATALGATEGGSGSQAFDGVINAPILQGKGAVRLVLYREVQGGYIDDAGLGANNVNRSERDGGRLAIRVKLSGDWEVSAGLASQTIDARDTQYAFVAAPPYTRSDRLREPHDNDFSEYHLGARGLTGLGEVRASLAYISHGLFSRYDASSAPPYPVPPGPAAFDVRDDIEGLVAEATLSSRPGSHVQWLAGVFFAHDEQTTHSALSAQTIPPRTTFSEDRNDRLDEGALYGEATFPLPAAFELTLGGRLFATRTRTSSLNAAPLAGAAIAFSDSMSQAGVAPKIVLSFKPAPWTLTYLQASEGYRAGGFNTIQPPGQSYGGAGGLEPLRRYQGDELWSVEAGEILSLDDGRLRLRAAGFEAFWNHIQSDQLLPSGLPFTANIGDGRNAGLELEGRYRVGDLELGGQLLTNGPDLSRANPALPLRADFSLSTVPDLSFGASAHYAWVLSDRLNFALDGRWTYVGGSRLTLDTAATAKMGNYSVGRLAATLSSTQWDLTVALDNPADTRGNTFSFGNPFSVRSIPQVTPLRPRTVTATIRYSF